MDRNETMEQHFEEHREHLRSVAYRMLGSPSAADDVVQEAWLRMNRADTGDVANPGGWLTTVVARLCLNELRSRRARPQEALSPTLPELVITGDGGTDPESQAVLADSVGVALLVVLEQLAPAERLAFVLHDIFAVPFEEIAPMVDRTPAAARQLASRARRRVQGATVSPDADLAGRRAVVDAFFAAARGGDFDGLVAILHPEVDLRSDGGTARPAASAVAHGAGDVASRAILFSQPAARLHPVVVNGEAGVVVVLDGVAFSVMAFTVRGDRIVAIDVLADPDRLADLDPALLAG